MTEIKIKETALELFATRGYESTTMRDIGKAVGIKGSSIYAHFRSKDEIFLQIAADLKEKIIWENIDVDTLKNSNIEVELKPLLFGVFKNYYTFFAEHNLELLFWQRLRFFPPVKLSESVDINRLLYSNSVLERYMELFQYGMDHKQLRKNTLPVLVISFFALVSGYADSLIAVPLRLLDQELEEGFNIYWDGIKMR